MLFILRSQIYPRAPGSGHLCSWASSMIYLHVYKLLSLLTMSLSLRSLPEAVVKVSHGSSGNVPQSGGPGVSPPENF